MKWRIGGVWFAMVIAALGAVAPPIALADLPAIRLDRIEPLGGAAGSTIELRVQGEDDEEAKSLLFDRPGFTAEMVEPRKFKVTIDANVPSGTYDVRLVGRFGVSGARLFAVSRGLTDVAEKESNNTPEEAQSVPLNAAINGVSDQNDVDAFRFTAAQGQRITLDCQAVKLDSQLNGVMTLATADGRLVASSSDYHGRDPFIDFVAPAAGDYVVSVYDLSYRGGHPYRLIVGDRPQIEQVSPRVIQAGKATEMTVLGRNLGPMSSKSPLAVDELPLDALSFQVTPPAEIAARGLFTYVDHPTDHAVLPTAATCTLTGMQVAPALDNVRAQTVLVTTDPVALEVEPNNSTQNDEKGGPQKITVPVVVSGRFDQPRDVDYYEFETTDSGPQAGGEHVFEVYCERIAGRADPYLTVSDDQGNIVLEIDDLGHRVNSFDGHLRDPIGQTGLQPKRKYRVAIGDRYSRGGGRFQYVFSVRRPRPDFFVAAIHRQNPRPTGVNLWRGGAEYLDLIIHRTDGHNGPITVEALDLPPGVHAVPTTIHDGSRGTFVLWADREAPAGVHSIRLVARGMRGDVPLEREVRPYTRVWNIDNIGTSRPSRNLAVAVCETAPYAVALVPAEVSVEAGRRAELKAVATRHWPEMKDAIRLTPLAFPGGINMGTLDIPAGGNEVSVPIDIPAGLAPGRYTLAVQCQAQVPFNKDPKADPKPNVLHTLPSLPVTITVTAPPKK